MERDDAIVFWLREVCGGEWVEASHVVGHTLLRARREQQEHDDPERRLCDIPPGRLGWSALRSLAKRSRIEMKQRMRGPGDGRKARPFWVVRAQPEEAR